MRVRTNWTAKMSFYIDLDINDEEFKEYYDDFYEEDEIDEESAIIEYLESKNIQAQLRETAAFAIFDGDEIKSENVWVDEAEELIDCEILKK